MDVWSAAKDVTSVLSLAAFAIAAAVTVARRWLLNRERAIEKVPPEHRLEAIQSLFDSFLIAATPIDTSTLSADQKFTLLREQIGDRRDRFRVVARSLVILGVVLFAAFGVAAWKPGGDKTPPMALQIRSVRISPDNVSLVVGETIQLMANVEGVDPKATLTVMWTSSNAAIAKVDAAGKVTAIATGIASISATSTAEPSQSASVSVRIQASAPGTSSAPPLLHPKGYYVLRSEIQLRTSSSVEQLIVPGRTLSLRGSSVVHCVSISQLNGMPAYLVEFKVRDTNSDVTVDLGWQQRWLLEADVKVAGVRRASGQEYESFLKSSAS
jgi:hypothetical protein